MCCVLGEDPGWQRTVEQGVVGQEKAIGTMIPEQKH